MTASRNSSDKKDEKPILAQQSVTIDHSRNPRVRPRWTQNPHIGSTLSNLRDSLTIVAPFGSTVIAFCGLNEKTTHLEFVNLQSEVARGTVYADGGKRTLISYNATQFLMVCPHTHKIQFFYWKQASILEWDFDCSVQFPKELQGKDIVWIKLSSDEKHLLLCTSDDIVAILNLEKKSFGKVATLLHCVSDLDLLDTHRLIYSSASSGVWEYNLTTQQLFPLLGTLEQPASIYGFYVFQNRWILNTPNGLVSYKKENDKLVEPMTLAELTPSPGRGPVRKGHVLIFQEHDNQRKQPGDFFQYDDNTQRTTPLKNIHGVDLQQVYLMGFTSCNQLAFLCKTEKSVQSKVVICDLESLKLAPDPEFINQRTQNLLEVFHQINKGIPKGVASIMASYLSPGIQLSDSKLECDPQTGSYNFRA